MGRKKSSKSQESSSGDVEMATGALAAKPHEDFGGDHARPSTADLNQVVQVDDAAIFKAGANAMMGAGVKGLGELRQMNMLKKENR